MTHRKITVLIVDDDPECTEAFKVALSQHDRLDVRSTTSAGEALGLLDITRPDILITDYRMPSHDGIELTSFARTINPVMTIIMITGVPFESLRAEAIRQGVDLILTKPISLEEVGLMIDNLVKKIDAIDMLAGTAANSVFTVNLNNVSVLEIAQMFNNLGLSGQMILDQETETGSVYFQNGKIVHAQYGTQGGEKAFIELCHWKTGRCKFLQNSPTPVNSIGSSTTSLFLNACKVLDEKGTP